MKRQMTLLIIATGWLAGCDKEQPPRSVSEFIDNPILLEAAMVRCAQDRSGTRYDAECMNAREAVGRIEAKEETARRAEFDALSEKKRQALRRTQEAASAARQRRAEAEKQRVEAEYLAQFGVPLPTDERPTEDSAQGGADMGNTPQVVIPEAPAPSETPLDENTPPEISEPPQEPNSDLDAVRDELRRRSEDSNN